MEVVLMDDCIDRSMSDEKRARTRWQAGPLQAG